jgi:DNA damage-binding protein 1
MPSLHKVASYRISTAPVDLYVSGKTIIVADLMKSISILEVDIDESGVALTEVARHFAVVWGTATIEIDTDTYLESDAEGNLIVLYRDRNLATEDDQRRLAETSSIRLGEMVNRIRRIDVPTLPSAPVIPRAFLATVS